MLPLSFATAQNVGGANLCAAASALGGPHAKTIRVETPQVVSAGCTIPEHVALEFTETGQIFVNKGQVLNHRGPIVNPSGKQIFYNALSGQGTLSLAGNKFISTLPVRWLGAQGDGATDDTAAIQAALNIMAAAGKDANVSFAPGRYILGGTLQEPAGSNAQIVLPKRGAQLAVRLVGEAPVSNAGTDVSTAGVVIESALTSGTGAMIGVRGTAVFNRTNLFLYVENITFRTAANPTYSVLDLRNVLQVSLKNLKVETAGTYNKFPQPTGTASYGIRLPANTTAALSILDNVSVAGFYYGIEWGELANADSLALTNCYVGLQVPAEGHSSQINRVLMINNRTNIQYTGGVSRLDILNLDIEHTKGTPARWFDTVADIDDPKDFARGHIDWMLVTSDVGVVTKVNYGGAPSPTAFNIVGGRKVALRNRDGVGFPVHASLHASAPKTLEVNSNGTVADNTLYPLVSLVHGQTGTANNVGVISFSNRSVTTPDKRVAQIGVGTRGATNSGEINFATMNAGTLGIPFSVQPNGFRLGVGAATLAAIDKGTVTINPENVGAGAVSTQTFAISNARVGDTLILNVPAAGLTPGLLVTNWRVSSSGVISVTFYNATGSAIDEPSGVWNHTLIKSPSPAP